MKLFFVRHGDTDYRQVESRGVRGWATSFAPLTNLGRLQIDTIAGDFRLQETQGILCSSYARALESAARLSRALNKPLYVEYDLHEWLPQKDSLADLDPRLLHRANEQLRNQMRGVGSAADAPWETLDEVRDRVIGVLRRYGHMSSVVVVTHAVVISALAGIERLVEHAEIVPCEIDLDAPAGQVVGGLQQLQ
ncbi:MAG TPA: histidine phosphatase family protein [Trueperaceae bacterium]